MACRCRRNIAITNHATDDGVASGTTYEHAIQPQDSRKTFRRDYRNAHTNQKSGESNRSAPLSSGLLNSSHRNREAIVAFFIRDISVIRG